MFREISGYSCPKSLAFMCTNVQMYHLVTQVILLTGARFFQEQGMAGKRRDEWNVQNFVEGLFVFIFLFRLGSGLWNIYKCHKNILQIVGERCTHVEKFIIPKELTYRFKINSPFDQVVHPCHVFSSTLNTVIVNGSCLTQLTLKRNIPNNMFLNEIGRNCPCLQELDIAGAEVSVMNWALRFHNVMLNILSRLWQTLGLFVCYMQILSRSSSNVGTERGRWGSRRGVELV